MSNEGKINEGKIFEELVRDYGKEPNKKTLELLECPEMFNKCFWLRHQDNFFRLTLIFSGLTLLFFILL